LSQIRVFLPEALITEPEPVHHPGSEIFHDHIGTQDQAPQRGPTLVAACVDHERAFVAVHHGESRTDTVARRNTSAHQIALSGFDLDHVRTLIAEDGRTDGAGIDRSEVDDPDAGQRPRESVCDCTL